jgi:peptidoglycan/LPS O-acetylase OafA/YrhL
MVAKAEVVFPVNAAVMQGRSLAPEQARLPYMDNLRATAMLLGVVFHAALAHSVFVRAYWPPSDKGTSWAVDAVVWCLHVFRMPLFFLIAGFFVALLVQRDGVVGMLRNRAKRVVIPFVLFWPVMYATMTALTILAAQHVGASSPMLMLIKDWLLMPDRPAAPPTLMHLWFLPYLICFCVLVWVADALELKSRWLACIHDRPAFMVWAFPLAFVLPLVSVAAPFPAPESVFPQWWALSFFGIYFWFGYRLYHAGSLLDALRSRTLPLLAGGAACYIGYSVLLQSQNPTLVNPLTHAAIAILEAYAGFWLTLALVLCGRRWLSQTNRVLRYVADASYRVYLVHLPILFGIQYAMMDMLLPWPAKLVIALVGTFTAAFVSYALLVRRTSIGVLLNGGVRRPAASQVPTSTASRMSTSN